MTFGEIVKQLKSKEGLTSIGALEILKYIGPGFLVTVGFIDPGNWATNVAAGSWFGYPLLWVITLSTIMLIILQHNVAHLGIVTGLCLSEATTAFTPGWISKTVLSSAMVASVSTSLAEILGGAIALNMLFNLPIPAGSFLIVILVGYLILANSYMQIEKWIIGFVSLIGLSFIYELKLVKIDWAYAAISAIRPSLPENSIVVVMSVLGAVVMPHNLFLHSEIIQSRHWNLEDESVIKKQLDYEFFDTLFSMFVGWGINCAMLLLAAATFYHAGIRVDALPQAEALLKPLLGKSAALVFAVGLLFSGISSSVTSGMAGGSIFAGMFGRSFNVNEKTSRSGILISLISALFVIFLIKDPFKGLIISQMILSIQLPITIFLQIYLTSSKKVMNKFANGKLTTIILLLIGASVTYLNVILFAGIFK
ncbi:MAG: Nramp family divalent metal transporter [Candidatus Kryptoniota bacterium]